MKNFILGVIIGVVALFVFLSLGGGRYLKTFGAKTEEAGARIERYEKDIKKATRGAEEAIKDTVDAAKKKAAEHMPGR
jgi:hypothetical protein